jgi:hypothetical protein
MNLNSRQLGFSVEVGLLITLLNQGNYEIKPELENLMINPTYLSLFS